MYYLPKQKSPQIDIFIQTSDGDFVSLNKVEEQIKGKMDKNKKKISNYEQQISVGQKLLRNYNYNVCRNILWGLCIVSACCTFIFSSNKQLHRKCAFGALGAGIVDLGAGIVLSKREKKLKQQIALLRKQEQELA